MGSLRSLLQLYCSSASPLADPASLISLRMRFQEHSPVSLQHADLRHSMSVSRELIQGRQGWLHGLTTCDRAPCSEGLTFDLMLCCCHLEIFTTFWTLASTFSFCTGPYKLYIQSWWPHSRGNLPRASCAVETWNVPWAHQEWLLWCVGSAYHGCGKRWGAVGMPNASHSWLTGANTSLEERLCWVLQSSGPTHFFVLV